MNMDKDKPKEKWTDDHEIIWVEKSKRDGIRMYEYENNPETP